MRVLARLRAAGLGVEPHIKRGCAVADSSAYADVVRTFTVAPPSLQRLSRDSGEPLPGVTTFDWTEPFYVRVGSEEIPLGAVRTTTGSVNVVQAEVQEDGFLVVVLTPHPGPEGVLMRRLG